MKYLKLFEDYSKHFKTGFMTMEEFIEENGETPNFLDKTVFWDMSEIKYLFKFVEKLKIKYDALFIIPLMSDYDKYSHVEIEIGDGELMYYLNTMKTPDYFVIRFTSKALTYDQYYVCEDVEGIFAFMLNFLKEKNIPEKDEIH